MTPEQQRIKIAEVCGWVRTSIPSPLKGAGETFCKWENPSTGIIDNDPGYDPWHGQIVLPDYLNDLNAMHEAEKVLTEAQLVDYYNCLMKLAAPQRFATATAAQRAEAFLRTLNLWKE